MIIRFYLGNCEIDAIEDERAENFMKSYSVFSTSSSIKNILSILIDGIPYSITHIQLSTYGNVNIYLRRYFENV